jgi:hypothetical protein
MVVSIDRDIWISYWKLGRPARLIPNHRKGTNMSQSDSETSRSNRKGKMEIFRAPGEPLGPELMPIEGWDESITKALSGMTSILGGSEVRCLYRQSETNGPSLAYAWFKSGYILPRHSHDADCLYYVIAGELRMGNAVLKKGDGMFVPANAGYTFEAGPDGAEFVEFRTTSKFSFLFNGNDEAHWERMRKVDREKADVWPSETLKPSDRLNAAE